MGRRRDGEVRSRRFAEARAETAGWPPSRHEVRSRLGRPTDELWLSLERRLNRSGGEEWEQARLDLLTTVVGEEGRGQGPQTFRP